MRYNFKEIGNRVRKLRKARKWSQDDFVEQIKAKYLPITRKTISRIEQGDENKFTLPFLLTACDVFDCDMGYLLGEYGDCKTRDNQFIHDKTGLTELSINRLTSHRVAPENGFIEFLLSSDRFFEIDHTFSSFLKHIEWYNSCIKSVHQCEAQAELIDQNSLEYKKLNEQWNNWMESAKHWAAEQEVNIYQMGMLFGNMLNQYKIERVIVYGPYREN